MLSRSLTLPVSDYRARAMGWAPNPESQPFAAPLRRVLAEPEAQSAIHGTLKLSLLTVLSGGLWGVALALLWWRREFPGRRFFAALGYAPLLMPPLVGTLAFYRLIGGDGLLWAIIPLAGGKPWASPFGRVLLLHTYAFGIYTYAYTAAALQDCDLSREEAARSLGAGRIQTFFAAVWPLIRPAILASGLLTFMGAAASFSAPYILDNSGSYLTVSIVNNSDDPGLQSALGVLLAALSLFALPMFLYFNRQGYSAGTEAALAIKGSAARRLAPASKAGTRVRLLLSLAAAVILLAPLAMVVAGAFAPGTGGNTMFHGFKESLNADNLAPLWRSGGYAAAAAAIDVALAVVIALAMRQAGRLTAMGIEFSVMLTVAIPGSVVALALLSSFNGPSLLTFGLPLGYSSGILILAYVVRDLPLAVRPARAAMQAIDSELERAAASLGARQGQILWRIVLPLLAPSLLAAGLICFITGAGEFVASKLLFDARTKPVSVRIDELFHTDPGAAFVLALWLMLFSAVAVGLRFWIDRSFSIPERTPAVKATRTK